jgi:hypothetical protein
MPSRRHAAIVLLMLACGPDSGDVTATDGGQSSSSTSSPLPTSTGVAPTSSTTGEPAACGGVVLPQGLPTGMEETYWVAVDDVSDPVDAVQLYMVRPAITCTEDPPCAPESPAQLFGYFVVLDPDKRTPGVYPITESDGGVDILALISEGSGEGCSIPLFVYAAADGNVEVLADDGGCIAIDVREVTPTAYKGLTLDPNGSAMALAECAA